PPAGADSGWNSALGGMRHAGHRSLAGCLASSLAGLMAAARTEALAAPARMAGGAPARARWSWALFDWTQQPYFTLVGSFVEEGRWFGLYAVAGWAAFAAAPAWRRAPPADGPRP